MKIFNFYFDKVHYLANFVLWQKFIRQVFYYKSYFLDFYKEQSKDVQKKFNWTLELISVIDKIPKKYFDHMTGTDDILGRFHSLTKGN